MLRTRTTRALVAATVLGATVVLGGCGDSSTPDAATSGSPSAGASSSPAAPAEPSMGELYTKVRAASLAAKSGHLSGTVTQGGQKTTLDVAGLADGSEPEARRRGRRGQGQGRDPHRRWQVLHVR